EVGGRTVVPGALRALRRRVRGPLQGRQRPPCPSPPPGEGVMELFERLSGNRPDVAPANQDPFAELKDSIHRSVITGLGPKLFNTDTDPETLRHRVIADIQGHLAQEGGISREDRERLISEIADDILGHGPLERLLADETITEIMVNGPHDIWIERGGRLHETPIRFNDDSHLR